MTVAHQRTAAIQSQQPINRAFLAGLLAAAGLVGGVVGGTLAVNIAVAPVARVAPAAAQAPLATFDATAFRAEERLVWPAAQGPTFDAVGFRAEERQPLHP